MVKLSCRVSPASRRGRSDGQSNDDRTARDSIISSIRAGCHSGDRTDDDRASNRHDCAPIRRSDGFARFHHLRCTFINCSLGGDFWTEKQADHNPSQNWTQTVFAIDCREASNNATTTDPACSFDSSITLTQGPSTVVYTMSVTDNKASHPLIEPGQRTTIDCVIYGADLRRTPLVSASKAVCTGSVPISDLGYVGTTTTLLSDQLRYVGVTVTAGGEKLATITAPPATTTSAAATGMLHDWRWRYMLMSNCIVLLAILIT